MTLRRSTTSETAARFLAIKRERHRRAVKRGKARAARAKARADAAREARAPKPCVLLAWMGWELNKQWAPWWGLVLGWNLAVAGMLAWPARDLRKARKR